MTSGKSGIAPEAERTFTMLAGRRIRKTARKGFAESHA